MNEVSLSVRSIDRINGDKDSFTVALPEAISFKRAILVDAEIPATWYTIGDRNAFTVGEWDNVQIKWATVYIQQGIIQGKPNLCIALKAALDAASPLGTTYTVTYDQYTDQITYTAAGMRNIWFEFDDSNIADIMGFNRRIQYTGMDSPTIKSVNSPMLGIQDLYLYIQEIPTRGMTAKRPSINYTYKLAIHAGRFGITDYLGFEHDSKVDNEQPLTINKLTVSLKDGDGAPVKMRNDWSFTLKFLNC